MFLSDELRFFWVFAFLFTYSFPLLGQVGLHISTIVPQYVI
jgi:hypothetical protein